LNLQCGLTFGAFYLELLLYYWTVTRVHIGENGLKRGWSLFSKQIQNTDVPIHVAKVPYIHTVTKTFKQ
jgi:hypothetical protein